MSRKETPDLLSQLMGGNIGIEQENNKAINHASNINSSPDSNKTIKQESGKEKTTFNLSLSTLEKLEDSWIKLRRQIKDKGRITKTLIVERAIELAIQEFEEKGESSLLYQDLSELN